VSRRISYIDILKVAVGISLLLISFWGVNWDQLKISMGQITPIELLAVVGAVVLGMLLKVIRWYLFLLNFGLRISFYRAIEAFFLGQATNILLPWRAGEVLRVGYLAKDQPASIPHVTVSVALEKILDLVALASAALLVTVYLPDETAVWVKSWLYPLSILAIVTISAVVGWGSRIWGRLRFLLGKWSHPWVKKGIHIVDQLLQNSLWLRDPFQLAVSICITGVIWAVMWITNILLFNGLDLQLPPAAGGLVLVLVYIGVLPALMPGNIGPFYFFAQLGVTPFGINFEESLAFAILLHGVVTLIPLVVSGISLLLSGSTRNSTLSI